MDSSAFRKTVWKNPFNFTNTKVPLPHGGLSDSSSHVKEVPNDLINFQMPSIKTSVPEPRIHGKVKNVYHDYMQLSKGISEGSVEAVEDFLNRRPDAVDEWINPYETPLLKACACGKPEIVKVLLRRMTRGQILPKTSQSTSYHTPLTVAAVTGNMEIAKYLLDKNAELLKIAGINGQLPAVVAIENGHTELAQFLFSHTIIYASILIHQDGYHSILLILNAIYNNMPDIALYFIRAHSRSFRFVRKHLQIESTPIIVLASKPDLFPSGCRLGAWKRIIYACLQVKLETDPNRFYSYYEDQKNTTLMRKLLKCLYKWTGIEEVYQLKTMHLQAKKLLLIISEVTMAMGLKERSETVGEALLFAVRYGNVDFLVEMIKNNSELLWSTRPSLSSTLFLLAVELRQEKVFNLLNGLDDMKYLLLTDKDRDENGMLHLAGHLSPPSKLSTLTGAALQMQRELQWFKEVERIVPETEKERVNRDGQTPIEIFRKEHQTLRQEAENWMKYTAMLYSLVATLIFMATFAAVFTNPEDSVLRHKPFRLRDPNFITFVVSDLISCFAACTSVLVFLGILTARYSFDDFLVSLPTKMIAGLSILFVSIAAMLVAFSSALFTMINDKWIVAPTILLACLPALLSVLLQYPLLKEMIFATYGKGLFDSTP